MNLTDHFIIAMPGLADPIFEKTVSYICQHSAEGALGITINRPTDMRFGELVAQMNIQLVDKALDDIPVYLGGPVETGHGFILHSSDRTWPQSLVINDEISLSSSKEALEAIAQGKGPEKFLVALGYSGWGGGQMEEEMLANAWLTVSADKEIIFDVANHLRWEKAAKQLGIDIHLMSGEAGHA